MSISSKGFILTAGTVVTAGIGLARGIIIARFLGPTGTGQYQMPMSLSLTIATFFLFGMGLASIYFLNFHKIDTKQMVANNTLSSTVLGLLAAAVMYYFLRYQYRYIGVVGDATKIVFSIATGLMVMQSILRQVLIARMEALLYTLVRVLSTFGMVLFLAALIPLHALNVETSLLAASLCQLIAFGVVVYGLRQYLFRCAPDLALMWRTFKHGIQLYTAGLLLTLDLNIGLLGLGFLLPGEFDATGYFSRAMAICGLIRLIPTSLTNLLYSHWCTVEGEQRLRQVEKVIRITLLFGFAVVAAILLTGRYLIVVMYGQSFLPALLPLEILAFQQLMWMISKVFQAFFSGGGRPLLTSANIAFGNVISVVALIVLVPHAGIEGAAIAVTLGQAVYLGMNFFQARRVFGLSIAGAVAVRLSDLRSVTNSLSRKGV